MFNCIDPIQFGKDPDLKTEECHQLLRDYMPSHVVKRKVLQKLYIK